MASLAERLGVRLREEVQSGEFSADRRAVVLARLRLVASLIAATIVAALLVDPPFGTDSAVWQVVGSTLQLGACAAAYAIAASSPAERWAERWAGSLAVSFLVVLTLCLPLVTPYTPATFDGAVGQLVLVVMLAALFLPWGVGPQAVLGGVLTGELLLFFPLEAISGANLAQGLLLFAAAVVLSLVGAHLLDRHRRAAFAERDQARSLASDRQLLLELGRELGETKDPSVLLDRVVRLARPLLACDSVDLQLYDLERSLVRIVAIDADDPGRAETALGLEFAPFQDLLALLDEGRVIDIPGDARVRSLEPMLRSGGVKHLLVAPITWEGQLLGSLDFVRTTDPRPFTVEQRELVHGIANQAAMALANARLVDDLRRANRVKSEFVSTMSHELRTPLHVVLGYAEMLGDPATSTGEVAEKIRFAARELLDLIEATLDLNRLESGRDEPELREVRIGDLLDELRDEYAALPRDDGVELVWTVCDGADVVRTDRRKLKIILKNLISNALKFTTQGRVEVLAARQSGRYEVSVEDTGEGIAAADLDSIFEMFQQVPPATENRRAGFGLGLYIVRRLADQLGAEVSAESQVGVGSRFRVHVPSVEADATPTSLAARAGGGS